MNVIRFRDIPTAAASHEDPKNPGVLKKVLLKAHDVMRGRVQMVNWATLLPGKSFVAHRHEDMQELFILLDGEVLAQVDGKRVALAKGDTLIVDPGEKHELFNPTKTNVSCLVIGVVI